MRLIIITSTVKLQCGLKMLVFFVWMWWALLESVCSENWCQICSCLSFPLVFIFCLTERLCQNIRWEDVQRVLPSSDLPLLLPVTFDLSCKQSCMINWLESNLLSQHSASTLMKCCPHVVKMMYNSEIWWKQHLCESLLTLEIFQIFNLTAFWMEHFLCLLSWYYYTFLFMSHYEATCCMFARQYILIKWWCLSMN